MASSLFLRFHMVPEGRTAVVAPLAHIAHIGGIMWFVASLMSGCTSVVADRFDRRTLGLQNQGITLADMGTTFHGAYLKHQLVIDEPFLPRVERFPAAPHARPTCTAVS